MHWKCSVCNLIWDGAELPEKCPKCSNPPEKFQQLSDEQWKLVEMSRFTNSLHIELLTILPRLQEIAQQGLEDDLDPPCVTLFQRLLDDAVFLEKSVKAELNGHMNRGKWG